jgi:predicted dehydrogenase
VYNAVIVNLTLLLAAALRIGIIGTDTSHVPAFTQALTEQGMQVVAAYKGGSKDVESSASRVDNFAKQIADKYNVEIVPDIPTLLSKVDAVLIESVDGRVHLEQARQVIAARKPFFIDKPLAATYEDAREIARLAKAAGVPWFSSSSLRFGEIAAAGKFSDVTGASTFGPGDLEPHHYLELSWYAIHTVELLYTLMGPGCESVTRTSTADTDVVVGRWKDGRIGTVRAIRPHSDYGAVVYRGKQIVEIKPQGAGSYKPLVDQIAKFFQSGVPPVPNDETLEIFAFMDAAQKSKEQGGRPVLLVH